MKSLRMCHIAGMALASACSTVTASPPVTDAAAAQALPPAAPQLSFDMAAYQRGVAELPGPPSNNVTLRMAATMTKSLPRDWAVSASLSTQYGTGDVTQQELFSPATNTSLSLMTKRDYLKDGGFARSVELRSPNLCAAWLHTCRAIMFYDRNYIRYNRDYGGQLRSGTVGSIGVGVRMQVRQGMNLQLDAGRVTRNNQMPDDARARVSLRLGYSF
jgi:hemolysin activation/secretion protein